MADQQPVDPKTKAAMEKLIAGIRKTMSLPEK